MKRVLLLVGLALLLTTFVAALEQDPIANAGTNPAWQASYWDNPNLFGAPVLEGQEIDIDHNWGAGSPDPSLSADGFSARWTRYIFVTAGTYRFAATSDDGIRVRVDGDIVIDEWHEHPATIYEAQKTLSSGHHWIIVEYFERQGEAIAQFDWEPITLPKQEWRAEFFDNMTLNGLPAFVRSDAAIDFDWGAGSPDAGSVGADRFSVRWSRVLSLPPGRYRFTMTVDDGGRVWVNDQLLIDAWYNQSERTFRGEVDLSDEPVSVKMEYYEHTGLAVARLAWERVPERTVNWRGEYFNNIALYGEPALVRDDTGIRFAWDTGTPAPGIIGTDRFSVRWTRTLDLPAGQYRFKLTVDDGGRLWVAGRLLIDAWRVQAAETHSAAVELLGGPVAIKVEYYDYTGAAVAQLAWSQVGPEHSPGAVVVDDTDPGFIRGGSRTGWHSADEGHNGHFTWTRNNDWHRERFNWASWYPSLLPGHYTVLVFIPDRYTTTTNARYTVKHAGSYSARQVDQSVNADRWVSLGTFWFDGSHDEYVSLTDATDEPRLTRLLAFDAVQWVPA